MNDDTANKLGPAQMDGHNSATLMPAPADARPAAEPRLPLLDDDWMRQMVARIGRVVSDPAHRLILIGELAEQQNRAQAITVRALQAEARLAALVDGLEHLGERHHRYCEDCWYSCPKAEDGCCDQSQGDDCNCGADVWNIEYHALLARARQEEPQP